jgi:hypothetical protein
VASIGPEPCAVPGTGHCVCAGFLATFTADTSNTTYTHTLCTYDPWLSYTERAWCLTSCRSRHVKKASSSLWRQFCTRSCLVAAVTHACWHFSDCGKGQQARPDQLSPLLISGTRRRTYSNELVISNWFLYWETDLSDIQFNINLFCMPSPSQPLRSEHIYSVLGDLHKCRSPSLGNRSNPDCALVSFCNCVTHCPCSHTCNPRSSSELQDS